MCMCNILIYNIYFVHLLYVYDIIIIVYYVYYYYVLCNIIILLYCVWRR